VTESRPAQQQKHQTSRDGGRTSTTAVPAGDPPAPAARLYRIPEAMRLLSMSRTVIYEQIRAGRLRSVQQGRSRLVSAAAVGAYIALLEEEAGRPAGKWWAAEA
jgi:excisionase family DNA binding protein